MLVLSLLIAFALAKDWAVKLKPDADPILFAQQHGFLYKGPVEFLPTGYYMFQGEATRQKRELVNHPDVLYIREQTPRVFRTR
jgi:hypothetical protein